MQTQILVESVPTYVKFDEGRFWIITCRAGTNKQTEVKNTLVEIFISWNFG